MTYSQGTAANVRAELARRKMSGRELARRLDESPQWTWRRINGLIPMSLDDLGRMAAALGLPPAELLHDSQDDAA